MRMRLEPKLGLNTRAFDHAGKTGRCGLDRDRGGCSLARHAAEDRDRPLERLWRLRLFCLNRCENSTQLHD